MDSNWLDDLIALLETDSLSAAAGLRNVTQPAFSRRIQALEAYLGSDVLDRTRRPARPTSMICHHIDDIRLLSRSIDRLRNDLRRWDIEQWQLVVAAQHSISIGYLPRMVTRLQAVMPTLALRINAANWDECFAMLMTGQALIMFGYETPVLPTEINEDMLEKVPLRPERLIPIASHSTVSTEKLGIISYPEEVFLGKVLHGYILPALAAQRMVSVACEVALTSAVLQLALQGVGVAWVPEKMARPYLETGSLHDLSPVLGDFTLMVVMLRLRANRADFADAAWRHILAARLEG